MARLDVGEDVNLLVFVAMHSSPVSTRGLTAPLELPESRNPVSAKLHKCGEDLQHQLIPFEKQN